MKNKVFRFFCLIFVGLYFGGQHVQAEENQPSMMDLVSETEYQVNPADQPKGAVLIDANTGKLLWSENADAPRNPASIMKLMTLYMVYESMATGKFNLDTEVTATSRHQQMSKIYALSNNKIIENVNYPVRELIPLVLVPSSNVATIMLSELVDENPAQFIQKMNETAKQLGMNNTTIYNATGAQISSFQGLYGKEGDDLSNLSPSMDNETTARDIAILTYYLLKKYPEILEYTKDSQVSTMEASPYEESFESYNQSLASGEYPFEGVDGLKTGSSPSGGFNISMTGQQGDLRLITTVFGVGNWADQTGELKRHPFANAIFSYGFKNFSYETILTKGNHKIDGQEVKVEEDFKETIKKGSQSKFELIEGNLIRLKEPLPQVSNEIKPSEVHYQKLEKLEEEQSNNKIKAGTKQKYLAFIITGLNKVPFVNQLDLNDPIVLGILASLVILLFLFILFLILTISSVRRRKKRSRQGKRTRR